MIIYELANFCNFCCIFLSFLKNLFVLQVDPRIFHEILFSLRPSSHKNSFFFFALYSDRVIGQGQILPVLIVNANMFIIPNSNIIIYNRLHRYLKYNIY